MGSRGQRRLLYGGVACISLLEGHRSGPLVEWKSTRAEGSVQVKSRVWLTENIQGWWGAGVDLFRVVGDRMLPWGVASLKGCPTQCPVPLPNLRILLPNIYGMACRHSVPQFISYEMPR